MERQSRPGDGGADLALFQAGHRVAVVCTTRDEGAFARAKTNGFDECLVVPFDVGELVEAVGRAAKAARTDGA